MSSVYYCLYLVAVVLFVFHYSQASTALPNNNKYQCSPFSCGRLGDLINFPFINNPNNSHCGSLVLNCSDDSYPKLHFPNQRKWYYVDRMSPIERRIIIRDPQLQSDLEQNRCHSLSNFTLPTSPFFNFYHQEHTFLKTFFKCKQQQQHHDKLINTNDQGFFFQSLYNYSGCVDGYVLYFTGDLKESLPALPEAFINNCSIVEHPIFGWWWGDPSKPLPIEKLSSLLAADYSLGWEVDSFCFDCYSQRGGFCQQSGTGNPKYNCGGLNNRSGGTRKKIAIGLGTGFGGILLACVVLFLLQRRKRINSTSAGSNSWTNSSDCSSLKQDVERGSMSLLAPIFTYNELEEATNNFDPSEEIGDGGFGAVYHGKLQDGRHVAVKRLYKNNYKHIEKFINEVTILSRLRHPNLVALYGCTSRHSPQLLLVYEFVPNSTVADHVYGERAKAGLLTWPLRMTIAIETADALAYLHASDTIHRDVKTTNILLDKHFHVKVADFGLSRRFPRNATHVSTAPQGTPGYVDPEYHLYYQLNDKSDVYSFGVVLIELISSKPAVDITRHRHEINLANMAMTKILNHALHELVDPCLGFDSDFNVRTTMTLVSELAFRCLQQERELRPSMMEVVESLRDIKHHGMQLINPEAEVLDNTTPPFSPSTIKDDANISVTLTPTIRSG